MCAAEAVSSAVLSAKACGGRMIIRGNLLQRIEKLEHQKHQGKVSEASEALEELRNHILVGIAEMLERLRICPGCLTPFFSTNTNMDHCSSTCTSRLRAQRFRERKKKQKAA
jgi:hypothetical protein